MKRIHPVYGEKRDYPKIDLFTRTLCPTCRALSDWRYVGSTNWARTCREAVDRYHACMGLERGTVRAQRSAA
jgi:hypothetical protein